jgi:nucleoside-diphosphate-sugar epimerase
MKVLVLGGSSFVGRGLVESLLEKGDDVAVLNRGRTSASVPEGVEQLVADRKDWTQMQAALGSREWDAVVDVSAFVQVAGQSDMAKLIEHLDGRVGRYVFVSSIMAYEPLGIFPWKEDAPVRPDPPTTYGGFKVMVERLVLDRHAATGFPGTAVRPAAIYGPNNNIYDMEAAMFLRLERGLPILVPHDGLVVNSYGHVDDLVDAIEVMCVHDAAPGEIFNISAEAITTGAYVRALADIVGKDADVVFVPTPIAESLEKPAWGHLFKDFHHSMISIEKAEDLLGVRPAIEFMDGHRATYEWFQASGMGDADSPLVDPLWRASWDFEWEAEVAASVRPASASG